MPNTIRLYNGSTLQVRVGVLQGVGPQGPRGVSGPQGLQGGVGPAGPTGPVGQITQYGTKVVVTGGGFSLTGGTESVATFASVGYDDMAAASSTSTITLGTIGDYLVTAWLGFSDPGTATGYRRIRLNSTTNGDLCFASCPAVVGDATYVRLSWTHRTTVASEVLSLLAKSSQGVTVGNGALVVERVGSGAPGPAGPQGPAGPAGPTGAQGVQGPAGSSNSGFATYDQVDGVN